jgi:hypothetical protein
MEKAQTELLDQLQAGVLGHDEFQQQVIDQIYAGLHQYSRIPDAYLHCDLASREIDLVGLKDDGLRQLLKYPPPEIINPYPSQIKAMELFDLLLSGTSLCCEHGDPLSPSLGAYLYGPPGTGKTHLMAAYGRRLKAMLDNRLHGVNQLLGPAIGQAYLKYNERIASEPEATDEAIGYLDLKDDEITIADSPQEEFWRRIASLQTRIAEYEYQPTDLIYIGFQELFEVCKYSSQRKDAMQSLEKARVVFIDDIHPQGDPEQVQLVLHLLERRYEMGRAGTFLTTNLPTKELGGGDEMLGNRLMSRCAETLMMIDFSDCDDWRQTVKSRRITLVEEELDRRITAHQHREDTDQ